MWLGATDLSEQGNPPRTVLRGIHVALLRSWEFGPLQRRPWARIGGSWGHLGRFWSRLEGFLKGLARILGVSWGDLGRVLRGLGRFLVIWARLGGSWVHFRGSWGNLGGFRVPRRVLGRLSALGGQPGGCAPKATSGEKRSGSITKTKPKGF